MLDRDLALAARRFHGILLPEQIDELGLSDHDLRTRIESGALERLHERVLVVAGAPRTWTQAAAAAAVALPGGALGHEAAARILGLFGFRDSTIVSITGPLSAYHFLNGVHVRRTGFLPDDHVTTTSGIRHTTRARTVIDLAVVVRSDGRLQHIIETELAAKRLTWDEIEATFRSLATRGRPGIARARRVLQEIEGKPPTESKLERMYLDLLTTAGLPLPTMQVTAPWAEREPGRVDGMYRDTKSIVELDGRQFHVRNSAFERDRKRDQLAVLNGYVPTRFTYKQITGDPGFVVEVSRHLSGAP